MDNNENNNNGSNNNESALKALLMLHCAMQSEIYTQELKKNEGGYKPKTNIWEMLTVAEAAGPEPVAELVASVLAGVGAKLLPSPVNVLKDLFMALKYKVKLYDDPKREHNFASEMLKAVYMQSMDVAHETLYKELSEYSDEVMDIMCE